jgi:integrase
MRAPTPVTLREAANAWLDGARSGAIRNRSGDRYKPSAIRSYEASLRLRVLPVLGDHRLSEIRRIDVQDLADRLVAQRLNASTVQSSLQPLRAICRRAVNRGELAINPTTGLELPAVRGGRDRVASPAEAAQLIAALPPDDRALWATAMYSGLRRGELLALRWEEIDLAAGVIRVERSWDAKEGLIEPKTRLGRRKVPIAAVLRDHLAEHRIITGRTSGFVFGRSAVSPFAPDAIRHRAERAWKAAGAKLISLHESRHTFASLMIAAGVNAKALSTYMGHANIGITLDRYGHLIPGNEDEAATLLDAYLRREDEAARAAEPSTAALSAGVE